MAQRTVYVVQQVHWEYNDGYYDPSHDEVVRAFVSRERAELLRAELEAQEEREYNRNVIRFAGGLALASTHTEAEIVEFLRRHNAPLPPEPDRPDLERYRWWHDEWWDQVWEILDDAARIEFREMFDKVRFFEVVPMTLDRGGAPP
jgi:hypothetical protein